jgi:hypothetical protein
MTHTRPSVPASIVAFVVLATAGCSSDPTELSSPASTLDPLTGETAVSRAMEWVDAKLDYCWVPYGKPDSNDLCWDKPWERNYAQHNCYRRGEKPQWDSYRSDCSGLVSWSWGLPGPGRYTWDFAPFSTALSHVISASELAPGDAVNKQLPPGDDDGHIMLFAGWVTKGSSARFIEEPGCGTAITHAHEFTSSVTISGSTITPKGYAAFTAIRFDRLSTTDGAVNPGGCVVGGLYCGGDKLSGAANTLYKCTGGSTNAVVEVCSNGCSVNTGKDDSCNPEPASSCVAGGYYCGGDKLSGDSNTLFLCSGGLTNQVVQVCSNGCSVNPGKNDTCKSWGSGNCVTGGYYCGGDKVTGDRSTLYKCVSGNSGTVAQACTNGCSVNAGKDDSCY